MFYFIFSLNIGLGITSKMPNSSETFRPNLFDVFVVARTHALPNLFAVFVIAITYAWPNLFAVFFIAINWPNLFAIFVIAKNWPNRFAVFVIAINWPNIFAVFVIAINWPNLFAVFVIAINWPNIFAVFVIAINWPNIFAVFVIAITYMYIVCLAQHLWCICYSNNICMAQPLFTVFLQSRRHNDYPYHIFLWKSTITSDKAPFFVFNQKILIFFISSQKHVLWVLIRSTFDENLQHMFLRRYKKSGAIMMIWAQLFKANDVVS